MYPRFEEISGHGFDTDTQTGLYLEIEEHETTFLESFKKFILSEDYNDSY